jgi:hypothetical protein
LNIINHTPFTAEAIPFKGPDGNAFVTLIVKGTFTVSPANKVKIADDQLPIAFGDTPYDAQQGGLLKFEADIAPFKPRADIVLVGHAHAPAGRAVTQIDISLRVGPARRTLRVFGDRQWHCPALLPDHPTPPRPFTKMPLVYSRAFGGMDLENGAFCKENLAGKGYWAKSSKKSAHQKPLPNIEDPQCLIRSPKDHPRPVGFGFYGRAWHPRVSSVGTYDEQWRKTRSPDPPADFKYDYYNAAHPELQWNGFLTGDEEVELLNMVEGRQVVRFRLPNAQLSGRVKKSYEALAAYLEKNSAPADQVAAVKNHPPIVQEVALNLDTLCLVPDENYFFLLWRGRTAVHDLTALEIDAFELA